MPIDYSKSKIYRLVGGTNTYYGSTCNPLFKRKHQHKASYESWLRGNTKYMTSYKCVEAEDYEIFLVEDYPCESKEQLRARERWWVENNECVNKKIPGRTNKEYCENNKEKILERQKAYREANREKQLERHKAYKEANKERLNINKRISRMFGVK